MEKPSSRAILFQFYVGASAGLGVMMSGAWLAWSSKGVPLLKDGEACCRVNDDQISWVMTLMDLGSVVSPIPSSYLMDWLGRKIVLYSTSALYVFASVLVLCANHVWYVFIARISVGLALGTTYVVAPIYLAEIASPEVRGAVTALFIGFVNIGLFYDHIVGWWSSYLGMNVANLIVPLLFLATFYFVPESPHYLITQGKESEAVGSLAKLRQLPEDDETLMAEYELMKLRVTKEITNKHKFWDVLGTKSSRRALLVVSMLAIFQRMSGIGTNLAYMTGSLPRSGGGVSVEAYSVIFSLILVVAHFVVLPLVDDWGRKSLLVSSSFNTAFIQAVAGTYYALREGNHDVQKWNWVPYATEVIFAYTYSLGLGFIPSILVGELFPQRTKSYASSIFAILLAVTSFCVNKLFVFFPVQFMYFFFSTACLFSTAFCHLYLHETKQKSLAQIQDDLQKLTEED